MIRRAKTQPPATLTAVATANAIVISKTIAAQAILAAVDKALEVALRLDPVGQVREPT
jgi:urease accessory protein UreF